MSTITVAPVNESSSSAASRAIEQSKLSLERGQIPEIEVVARAKAVATAPDVEKRSTMQIKAEIEQPLHAVTPRDDAPLALVPQRASENSSDAHRSEPLERTSVETTTSQAVVADPSDPMAIAVSRAGVSVVQHLASAHDEEKKAHMAAVLREEAAHKIANANIINPAAKSLENVFENIGAKITIAADRTAERMHLRHAEEYEAKAKHAIDADIERARTKALELAKAGAHVTEATTTEIISESGDTHERVAVAKVAARGDLVATVQLSTKAQHYLDKAQEERAKAARSAEHALKMKEREQRAEVIGPALVSLENVGRAVGACVDEVNSWVEEKRHIKRAAHEREAVEKSLKSIPETAKHIAEERAALTEERATLTVTEPSTRPTSTMA